MPTTTLERPRPATVTSRGRPRRRRLAAVVIGIAVSLIAGLMWWSDGGGSPNVPPHHSMLKSIRIDWPGEGQAAIEVVGAGHASNVPQTPVPIASVAKVMTAYVVLRGFPLQGNDPGFTMTFTASDAEQARADKAEGQSTVAVEADEVMTERQALQALLLPSANNIAIALAEHVAGTTSGFTQAMNQEAGLLGMRATTYTDPSGLDPTTMSTASDQLRLAKAAMRIPAFASIVAMREAQLPVAGRVVNTDALLGHDGFVGIKTGSTNAAGGCFMFEAVQRHGAATHTVIGVVLGQHGGSLIHAGLSAAHDLVGDVMSQLGNSPKQNQNWH